MAKKYSKKWSDDMHKQYHESVARAKESDKRDPGIFETPTDVYSDFNGKYVGTARNINNTPYEGSPKLEWIDDMPYRKKKAKTTKPKRKVCSCKQKK
jgi:hypothetical protein